MFSIDDLKQTRPIIYKRQELKLVVTTLGVYIFNSASKIVTLNSISTIHFYV